LLLINDLTKCTIPFIDQLFVYDMLRAYLLIICNPEVRHEIANIMEKLDNVVNVDIINGPYDLVVEIIFDTMEDLKEKVQHHINNIDRLMSTLTLIRSEDV
jgi:DNA-binding Lrp family transcriptional regulator